MIFRLALLDRSDVALKEAVQAFPKHPRAQEVFGILEARADDAAFDEAKKAGTIAALETYRRDRPRGRHVLQILPNNEWMGLGDEGFTVSSSHAFRYVARLEGDVQTPIDDAFRKEWMKETLTGLAPFVTASP